MTQTLEVPAPTIHTLAVTLEGTSPLITHRFGEHARKQIRDKQQGKGSSGQKKDPKDPDKRFRDGLYVIEGDRYGDLSECRFGVKAVGLKQAIVATGRTSDFNMTDLRQAVHVAPTDGAEDLLEIESPEPPTRREDRVNVGRGTLDLRYRPMFWPWSIAARVQFHAKTISAEQLLTQIQEAGFGVGLGDWRPEKGGVFGKFALADDVELREGMV